MPNLNNVSLTLMIYSLCVSIIGIPASLFTPYLLFRLIFMGSLSRYPRTIFGVEGSVSEFYAGAFVMLNVLSSLMGYSFLWFEVGNFYDTYKPGWADSLG